MTLRVFAPADADLAAGDLLSLDDEERHYLLRVRRAKVGAKVQCLDGHGRRWATTLLRAGKNEAVLQAQSEAEHIEEPPLWLLVGQCERSAMIEVVARSTELGVTHLQLLSSRYAQGGGGAKLPRERWRRCIQAAMRQSGRTQAPQILAPVTLQEALAHAPNFAAAYVAALPVDDDFAPSDTPRSAAPVAPASPVEPASPLAVAVGPEGGFTHEEMATFRAASFLPLRLGPWILRTEVAVTASLALLHQRHVTQLRPQIRGS